MAALKYKVELSESERTQLKELVRGGTVSARKLKRALTLLNADEGLTDMEIAVALKIGLSTVGRDEFLVDVDVEHTVNAGNEIELGDVLAGAAQGLARHPGGAQGMASMLAILQTYLESVLCHIPTPWTVLGNLTLRGRAVAMQPTRAICSEKKAAARAKPCRCF